MRIAAALLPLAMLAAGGSASVPKLDARALAAPPARPLVLSPAATQAVKGRERQLAMDCIDQSHPIAVRIVDRSAILWEISPRRWFVNVPQACPSLSPDRIVETYTGPSSRICQGNVIRILGTPDGRQRGTCRLGPFVPFTR